MLIQSFDRENVIFQNHIQPGDFYTDCIGIIAVNLVKTDMCWELQQKIPSPTAGIQNSGIGCNIQFSNQLFDDFGRRIVGTGCLAAADIFTGNVNEPKDIFSRFVYIIKIKKLRIFFTEMQCLFKISNQSIDQFVV